MKADELIVARQRNLELINKTYTENREIDMSIQRDLADYLTDFFVRKGYNVELKSKTKDNEPDLDSFYQLWIGQNFYIGIDWMWVHKVFFGKHEIIDGVSTVDAKAKYCYWDPSKCDLDTFYETKLKKLFKL